MGPGVHLHGRDVTYIHVSGFGRERVKTAPRSKLEAYFLLLETESVARQYKYAQISENIYVDRKDALLEKS